MTYEIAMLAGVISFLSPCILPLAPPYICYLIGASFDQMTRGGILPDKMQWHAVRMAVMFVTGFTTIFTILGASASAVGHLLASNMYLLSRISGMFIIIMGLNIIGLIRIPYLGARYSHGAIRVNGSGYVGAYLTGLAFTFGWTPCIGPVLATILLVAANDDTVYKGIKLLIAYSLGIGMPFILMAFAMKPFMCFVSKFRPYLRIMEIITGILLTLAGIAFFTGQMSQISFHLLELFPWLGKIG